MTDKDSNELDALTARMHTLEKRIAEMNASGCEANAENFCRIWDRLKARRDELKAI